MSDNADWSNFLRQVANRGLFDLLTPGRIRRISDALDDRQAAYERAEAARQAAEGHAQGANDEMLKEARARQAAEARERAKDEALNEIRTLPMADGATMRRIARAALAQQPAQDGWENQFVECVSCRQPFSLGEREWKCPDCAQQPADQGHGVYIASKTKHASRWRALRDAGWPIISTWIDEAGEGETACFTDLWRRCIDEARNARAVILYGEPGETLKGALVEAGAALASGVPVIVVGDVEAMKTARNHALVSTAESVEAALAMVARQPAGSDDQPDEWECSMCGEIMARKATWADCGHEHCPMIPTEMEAGSADQPAREGERLDPHTLERAAQVADERARKVRRVVGADAEGQLEGVAEAIRNLRNGGDT